METITQASTKTDSVSSSLRAAKLATGSTARLAELVIAPPGATADGRFAAFGIKNLGQSVHCGNDQWLAPKSFYLLRAKEMAPDGAEQVQVRYTHDANILTKLGKIVTNWLGNSPQVANRHYAMTMQSSFDQAVVRDAALPGVTSKGPQNLPQSLQDKGRQGQTRLIRKNGRCRKRRKRLGLSRVVSE